MLFMLAGAIVVLLAALWLYVVQPFAGRNGKVGSPAVEPRRLQAHVRRLSQTLVPRDEAHPENLDRVAAYIADELSRAGGQVQDQPFQVGTRTYRNVVAAFGPASDEVVVVGAHYDTAGPYPGADDNASGVAGLIELGRLLGGAQLASRVLLVGFTLEEPPHFLKGSAVYAAALKASGTKVRAMLSLEMIGYFTDAEHSQSYPLPFLSAIYPTRGNFIAVVGRVGEARLVRTIKTAMAGASALPVESINAPTGVTGIAFSDHASFWREGYPAAMITDTAFFRNPGYHSAEDTADKLDYARMAQVVSGVFAAVSRLSSPGFG
jgi:Zn-dependent M28 family amino/carboxypeptidase